MVLDFICNDLKYLTCAADDVITNGFDGYLSHC